MTHYRIQASLRNNSILVERQLHITGDQYMTVDRYNTADLKTMPKKNLAWVRAAVEVFSQLPANITIEITHKQVCCTCSCPLDRVDDELGQYQCTNSDCPDYLVKVAGGRLPANPVDVISDHEKKYDGHMIDAALQCVENNMEKTGLLVSPEVSQSEFDAAVANVAQAQKHA